MPYKTTADRTTYMRERNRDRSTRLKEAAGGACARCGYDKCIAALHFHHRDPATKLFRLAGSYMLAWDRLVAEVAKCDLLCANCHAEEHHLEDGKTYAGGLGP